MKKKIFLWDNNSEEEAANHLGEVVNGEGLNKGMQDRIIINKHLREEGVEGKVEQAEYDREIKDLRISRGVLNLNRGRDNNKITYVVEVDSK